MASTREQGDALEATVAATSDATLAASGRTVKRDVTLPDAAMRTGGVTLRSRPTVLPRRDQPEAPLQGTRYEAVRTLGAGGMGAVELVVDHDIGRTVAVKRPLEALAGDGLHRFAREVRTIGRLEHPGIVPIHDVGLDDDGLHYFVMKYVEGETLSHIIERLRAEDPVYVERYTMEARTQIFAQLCHAVRYAHDKGVLHRDIKPDNIMVGQFGEVMLMDWGIARDLTDDDDPAPQGATLPASAGQTSDGALLGTPAYMSPEQARGEINALDARSDVYSLCVVFYELVALRHYLADKRSTVELITSIGHEPDLGFWEWVDQQHRYKVPAELIHFLRKGMAKQPADRFQSVAEMIERLNLVRDHQAPVQCHVTFSKHLLGRLSHGLDQHARLYSFTIIIMLLLALGGAAAGIVLLLRHLG